MIGLETWLVCSFVSLLLVYFSHPWRKPLNFMDVVTAVIFGPLALFVAVYDAHYWRKK